MRRKILSAPKPMIKQPFKVDYKHKKGYHLGWHFRMCLEKGPPKNLNILVYS